MMPSTRSSCRTPSPSWPDAARRTLTPGSSVSTRSPMASRMSGSSSTRRRIHGRAGTCRLGRSLVWLGMDIPPRSRSGRAGRTPFRRKFIRRCTDRAKTAARANGLCAPAALVLPEVGLGRRARGLVLRLAAGVQLPAHDVDEAAGVEDLDGLAAQGDALGLLARGLVAHDALLQVHGHGVAVLGEVLRQVGALQNGQADVDGVA